MVTTITILPPVGSLDAPGDYFALTQTWAEALPTFRTELNTLGGELQTLSTTAETSADIVVGLSRYYASEAAGLAAVEVGEFFSRLQSTGDIGVYVKVDGSTATLQTSFPTRTTMNLLVADAQSAVTDSETAQTASETARDLAETYAGIDHRAATWADLALISGTLGDYGYVSADDTGTHTDPIATGTVPNAGVYLWAANGLGSAQAERIDGLASTGDASITAIVARGGGRGETNEADIALSFTFEDTGERTWLEVDSTTGGPSAFSAGKILASQDYTDLSAQQIIDLKVFLGSGASTPDVVTTAVSAPSIALDSQPQGVGQAYPTVVNQHVSAPMWNWATSSGNRPGSIFAPWIFHLLPEGIDKWMMVTSTDHGSHSNTGIFAWTADTPLGPWTYVGLIFRDDTGNDQTETPSVVRMNNEWHVFYQGYSKDSGVNVNGATGTQTSKYLRFPSFYPSGFAAGIRTFGFNPGSADIIGIAADNASDNVSGEGHTGYLQPFFYGGNLYAHTLQGSTGYSFWVWDPDTNPAQFVPHPIVCQRGLGGIGIFAPVIEKNGRLWKIGGTLSNPVFTFELNSVGAQVAPVVNISPVAGTWENIGVEARVFGNSFIYDGSHYTGYRGGGEEGGFGLMEIF